MPPKIRITKRNILDVALDLVRKNGPHALNARAIAIALECSTQPIFSNFSNMDDLHREVIREAEDLCNAYIQQEMERGKYPAYKASGMAYIRFAREESELFKLLYMRDRTKETDTTETEMTRQIWRIIRSNTGLDEDVTKLFHLEMWACSHGIATMLATKYIDLDEELCSRILTDTYLGLRKQYGME